MLAVQAEHGPDSQAVLVALPGVNIEAVQREVERQCDLLPRAETTRKALSHSCIVQVGSKEEAAEFSNRCALNAFPGIFAASLAIRSCEHAWALFFALRPSCPEASLTPYLCPACASSCQVCP